jgi:hypothetical protein
MLRVILNKTEVEFPSSKPSMAYPGINSKFFIITVHINTSFLLTSLVSSHRDRLCHRHYAPGTLVLPYQRHRQVRAGTAFPNLTTITQRYHVTFMKTQ